MATLLTASVLSRFTCYGSALWACNAGPLLSRGTNHWAPLQDSYIQYTEIAFWYSTVSDGCVPGIALLHLRSLTNFGMICRLQQTFSTPMHWINSAQPPSESTTGSIKFVNFVFSIFFLIHLTCSDLKIPRKASNDWRRRMLSTIGSNSFSQKRLGLTLYICSVPPSAHSQHLTHCGQQRVVHLLRLKCALCRVKWFLVVLEPNFSVANGLGISKVYISSPQNVLPLLKISCTSFLLALNWNLPESGWEASLMTTALSSLK